jgi:diguanylate cyclase (GGDEF)-like protein
VVVVAFDLDNFKGLNDQYGHEAGDAALSLVADVLTDASRDGDVVARTGGDEFVMVQVIPDLNYVPRVVERVREVVANTVRTQALGGAQLGITAGYSVTREGIFDLDTLMAEADSALLAGKRTDKGATYPYGHLTQPQG